MNFRSEGAGGKQLYPLVRFSVKITVRNKEFNIGLCLESILALSEQLNSVVRSQERGGG